jgi:hypothetical protein
VLRAQFYCVIFVCKNIVTSCTRAQRRQQVDLPEELKFDQLSYEEKYRRAVPGYMRRICRLYEAVYERFGEEGLDLIREVSKEYGTSIGTNVNKKSDVKGVAPVGKYLLKVFDMVSDDWEVTEFSERRMVIAVHRCPYPFADEEICRAHTCMEQALVATLDEDLEYGVGRCIPKGDPFCEHILCSKTDPK